MSSSKPDVLILFPPQWTPQNPPFALASLGGHLRSRGFQVGLLDLNLAFYEEVLTPEHLSYCHKLTLLRADHLRQKCQVRLMVGHQSPALEEDAAHVLRLESELESQGDPWATVAQELPWSVATLRHPERFYDPPSLVRALATVERALGLCALPYEPARLALNDFRTPRYPLSVEGMEQGTRDRWGNPFLYWTRGWVQRILLFQPSLLTISINSFSQVLAGLTLARALKQAAPDTHLTIGGNFFGRVADRLHRQPGFFQHFCDSLVVGEGEVILEQITRKVLAGQTVDGMPGVVTALVSGPPRENTVPLEEIGPLDLADLPLERYFTPEPVLCIQASRGCYWGKCTFCDSYWGVKLDRKSPHRLLEELSHLRQNYGVRHFEFIDECLPPADMRAMAQAISERDLDIHWFANARTENGFLDVLPELPSSGATMLLWGFESGSARVLKLLCKGVHPEQRWEVLRASAQAGLWNFAYVFFGFPSETHEEAVETIETLCRNTEILHSYGRSVYTLGRHSPVARDPERFGLSDIAEVGTDLSVNLTFNNPAGPSLEEIQERADLCLARCRQAYGNPLWMALRNRENLHLYLARYGAPRVHAWTLEPEQLGTLSFQK